jgi:hypothetical protein
MSWANAANAGAVANHITKVRQIGTGSLALSGANGGGGFSLTSESGHLILSSSTGVVMASGAVKFGQYAQADLPTGDTFSGSIAWVSDKKCFASYGHLGWQRILTGAL